MSQSAAAHRQRRAVKCALIGVLFVGGVRAGRAAAETVDSFAEKVRSVLQHKGLKKVLLVVREDGQRAAAGVVPAEVKQLRRQVGRAMTDLAIKSTEVGPDDQFPEVTLKSLPAADELRDPLQQAGADAAVMVVWKSSGTGASVRVAIINDSKLIWSGRSALKPAKAQARATRNSRQQGAQGGAGNAGVASLQRGGAVQGIGAGGFGGVGGLTGLTAGGRSTGSTAGSSTPGGTATAAPTEVNEKVLEFAEDHLGQKVGNGQCTALATEALNYAGAKPPDGYVFGQEVALSELAPGDILQFYNADLASPVLGWWHLGQPNHTAIVGDVNGSLVTIYQQNINGVMLVRKDLIDLSSLVSGQITGYRPIPAGESR